jgi:hypothetical protein
MAEVIRFVHERDHAQYEAFHVAGYDQSNIRDWPEMLWKVLSQPSGMAVIEILQASRSDPELAELVKPAHDQTEQAGLNNIMARFSMVDSRQALAALRVFVWTMRGLSIAQVHVDDSKEIDDAVNFFKLMVDRAFGQDRGPFE